MVYENFLEVPAGTNAGQQNVTTSTTPTPQIVDPFILSPDGFIWPTNNKISNGLTSSLVASGITDFTIINNYIHHDNQGGSKQFNPKSLLELATTRFNIYSSQYRNPSKS